MSSSQDFATWLVENKQFSLGADTSIVKDIYYPKYSPTRSFYDDFRHPAGGYGGLLSVTFRTTAEAVTFFDVIEVAKGPSLGTNFTLW